MHLADTRTLRKLHHTSSCTSLQCQGDGGNAVTDNRETRGIAAGSRFGRRRQTGAHRLVKFGRARVQRPGGACAWELNWVTARVGLVTGHSRQEVSNELIKAYRDALDGHVALNLRLGHLVDLVQVAREVDVLRELRGLLIPR